MTEWAPVVPSVGAVPVEVPVEVPEEVMQAAQLAAQAAALDYDNTWPDVIQQAVAAAYPLTAARVRAEADASEEQVISERDEYHEWADRLAAALGGDGIGEHSSANNPWQNALDLAADHDARVRAEERQRIADGLASHGAVRAGFGKALRGLTPVEHAVHVAKAGGVCSCNLRPLAAGSAVPVATPESSEDLLGRHTAFISRTVTASYPDGMDPELVMRRRVGKIFVEAGELGDAIEGWTGENPRKGVYAIREDVIKELIDCASASLCAIEYMTGDGGLSVGMVAQQVIGNAQRLSESIPDGCGVGQVATPTGPELPSQAIHAMTRRDQPRNHHLENVRYCERCGAQIEGPNAWGHDDHCPKREPSPAEQDGQR